MERLTDYKNGCKREMICRYEDCDTCEENCPLMNEDNCPCLQDILEKLAEYEDLEEQGKLLKLPCAVGDTVYRIKSRYSKCSVHSRYEYFVDEKVVQSVEQILNTMLTGNFGKVVFLTREEAEAALERREANETD